MKLDSVDVVMCTWNSNKPYFARCLESIKREIPVHHFLVVDRYSHDGTIEAVREHFGPVAVAVKSQQNLAKARMIGIAHVDTEYFVFVDSDVELSRGWFRRIASYVDDEVGACHDHGYVLHLPIMFMWTEWMGLDKRPIIDVTLDNMSRYRGCTHSTILKTSLVKDWKPSSSLSAYEDWMLLKHVVNKGYRWRIVNEYTVKHHTPKSLRECFRKVKWTFAGARITGFEHISVKRLPAHFLFLGIQALRASIKYKEPRILPIILIFRLSQIEGYLGWNKFVVLQRE